jgi:hypothetical protein
VSERDLELKLRTARWFWALGSAPVLRVRLTAYAGAAGRRGRSRAGLTDLADLDVLGIEAGTDFALRYRGAECKSAKAGAKELFWLRGVLDYFGGGDGYLVVQFDDLRTPALRELAARLGLGILTFNDFAALEASHPLDAAAPVIFSRQTVARSDELLNQPAKKLERLTDYALRSCWQLPQHRNLQQAIGYLRGAANSLDARQHEHVLLFGEVVMRYLLALFSLCANVLRRGYPHTRSVALAFVHGGELGLMEAQQRLRAVQNLQQQIEGGERMELADAFSEAPPYFEALLDVADRLLRRPTLATACLRQLTVALRGNLVAGRSTHELMPGADPIAAKLVNDVAAFLTRTAGLDRQLRERLADALDVVPPTPDPDRISLAADPAIVARGARSEESAVEEQKGSTDEGWDRHDRSRAPRLEPPPRVASQETLRRETGPDAQPGAVDAGEQSSRTPAEDDRHGESVDEKNAPDTDGQGMRPDTADRGTAETGHRRPTADPETRPTGSGDSSQAVGQRQLQIDERAAS